MTEASIPLSDFGFFSPIHLVLIHSTLILEESVMQMTNSRGITQHKLACQVAPKVYLSHLLTLCIMG